MILREYPSENNAEQAGCSWSASFPGFSGPRHFFRQENGRHPFGKNEDHRNK